MPNFQPALALYNFNDEEREMGVYMTSLAMKEGVTNTRDLFAMFHDEQCYEMQVAMSRLGSDDLNALVAEVLEAARAEVA